jgi:hypothetical protein
VSGLAGREICRIDGAAALCDSSKIRTVDSDTQRVLDKTWSIDRSTLKAALPNWGHVARGCGMTSGVLASNAIYYP